MPGPLVDLYVRPGRFFSGQLALGATPYVLFVTLVCGLTGAADRLDRQMIKADLGARSSIPAPVLTSWLAYWAFIAAVGALAAGFLWAFGGWWYNVRIRWSGATNADRFTGRLVYIYSSFVHALPALIILVAATAVYDNYQQYWHGDEAWSSAWFVFLFWSCVTSYKGVKTVFSVTQWKARVWFFFFPMVTYVAAFAAVIVAYVVQGDK